MRLRRLMVAALVLAAIGSAARPLPRQGKAGADPSTPAADLTDGGRAARNPDGVMFYKIWNGRAKPKMPAMKADIARADVWKLVHYVKSLRRQQPAAD